jgi:hypothetical protein
MMLALPVDPSATMGELDFRSLHEIYAAWRGRVPSERPRRVHISRELLANPVRLRYGAGLAAVLREVAAGDDLLPRMSTAVEHAYTPWVPPGLARRRASTRQVDRLLADWGLHHLHLRTERHHSRERFLARSDHVLFVAFAPNDAYLVDLARHETDGANWSALAILEIVARSWPAAGILVPSTVAIRLRGGNWSDNDRSALRAAGVSTGMVEIDGSVWSAGGQSLGGASMKAAHHCMAVSWQLSGHSPTEEQIRQNLAVNAAKHGVRDEWRAITHGEDFGFYSEGVFISYGSLLP